MLLPSRVNKAFSSCREAFWPWAFEYPGGVQDFPFGPYASIVTLDWFFIYVLALFGLAVAAGRWRGFLVLAWWVLFAPVLVIPAVHRYRLGADVPAIMAAGIALGKIFDTPALKRRGIVIVGGYLCLCALGTLVNWMRFSGPNLLTGPLARSKSRAAELMRDGVFETTGPTKLELFDVITDPGYVPQYVVKYDYCIKVRNDNEFWGPNVRYEFFTEKGQPVNVPVGPGSVLSYRHWLNRFQETTGTAWHVISVPALAKVMRLTFTNDIEGTVSVSRLQLRGPIWARSRD